MTTLLLELFSEEIPSRMQQAAAEQLQRLIAAAFEKNFLPMTGSKTFVSPRHLAIQCFGVPDIQPDLVEERKGPKIGAPEQAMAGFLNAVGLTAEQCEQRDGYYYAVSERKGQPAAAIISKIVADSLAAFSWPKSMRWGSRPLHWVRPLHSMVCLFGSVVVPVQFAHLTAGNVTHGHHFLSPAPLTITDAESYEAQLKEAHVVVDFATRRDWIATEVASLATLHGLSVVPDEALLNEVTGLVEWPVPLIGSFDEKFLTLPPEVLISEMKVHQRYFALQHGDGALANRFIAVANMRTDDSGKKVIAGNERVLRARLSDGEFYWEQDKKKPLRHWAEGLKDVVFHAKVGMMHEKVMRLEKLAVKLAQQIAPYNAAAIDMFALQAAVSLAKADLTSGMVGEFPELQGIMGRYYALEQGESALVADAIRDHYKPVGAHDSLPDTSLAALVAIADKLDSIIELFNAGEKPTGSKDPLALRRAALGILRIIRARGWGIELTAFTASPEIIDFFADRLKTILRDDQIRHDVIEASFSSSKDRFSPHSISLRAQSLTAWLASPEGAATLAAIKRAQNILAAEEKKGKTTYRFTGADFTPLVDPAEQKLLYRLNGSNIVVPSDLNGLTAPINAFFEAVLVNADDAKLRAARLGLLAGVRDAASAIADFSKIEG